MLRYSWLPLVAVVACNADDLGKQVCYPGELECTADGVRVCTPGGTGWQLGSCADDQVCIPGTCEDPAECPDTCKDIVCAPGQRVCGDDNVFIYQCDDTGTQLQSCGSCAAAPVNGVCSEGKCISLCTIAQKSYIGCEYYAVDLDNARLFSGGDIFGNPTFLDAENAQYAVVVSNPDPQVSAFVSVTRGIPTTQVPPDDDTCAPPVPDDSFVAAAVLPPKGIHIFELPARNVDGTSLEKKAYRVASNVPITAYQFNPLENVDVFSNDASLLLPTTALGKRYIVMTRPQSFDDLKGYLTVVGIDAIDTEVTVTVTARTLGGFTNQGVAIPAMEAGDSYSVFLRQFEVLNIETNFIGADLTGSTVVADRPIAVFGGSEAANAPNTSMCNLSTNKCEYDGITDCSCAPGDLACSPHAKCSKFITCCADHLEMQLFPESTWGTDYVAVRSYPRNAEPDAWRILASVDGTTVTVDPPLATVPTLNRGEWFEFETGADFTLQASEPVLVGQFLVAQDSPTPGRQVGDAGVGDPTFILIAPARQWRDTYVFLTPNKYAQDFVTIAAPVDAEVRLDGVEADEMPQALLADVGTQWRAIRVPVPTDGFHQLVCSAPCSIMVHGYDQYVSYGYPGGLNLEEE